MTAVTNATSREKRRAVRGLLAGAGILALLVGCSVKPEPTSEADRVTRLTADRAALAVHAAPVTGPIGLHEAIARAIKYNLDHRLAQMELAVQGRQLELAGFDMLPRLAATAGYNIRSNENASSSESILTHKQSLEPSTSVDRGRGTAALTFSWNILDFGVSYYQAKQQANRSLIAEERRRRVLNTLVQELRGSFWQAYAAQRLAGRLDPVLAEAERALHAAERLEQERLKAPEEALRYQKSLLEITRQLRQLKTEAYVAQVRLGSLMGMDPGSAYTLQADPRDTQAMAPDAAGPVAPDLVTLESLALFSRPELREEEYQNKIARAEIIKSKLRMLPGLSLEGAYNYDTNSFLVHDQWAEAGVRAAWNLVGILSGPTAIKTAEAQVDLSESRRLALTMAVITQVDIAYLQYRESGAQYREAAQLHRIEQKLYQNVSNAVAVDAEGQLEKIRASTTALAAEFRRDRSFADYQSAVGSIANSVGADPLPADANSQDLAALTNSVREISLKWERGDFGTPPVLVGGPSAVIAAATGTTTTTTTTTVAAAEPAVTAMEPAAVAPAPEPPLARTPPVRAAAAPVVPKQPVQAASVPADTAGGALYVDAGIYAKASSVDRLREALAPAPIEVVDTTFRGASAQRVRLGPFADAAEAQGVQSRAVAAGAPDARIVRR